MNKQIKPLNQNLACIWDHDWSEYADRIRVPMQDGNVITYRIEIEQPAPVLQKDLDRFTGTVFGYHAKRGDQND